MTVDLTFLREVRFVTWGTRHQRFSSKQPRSKTWVQPCSAMSDVTVGRTLSSCLINAVMSVPAPLLPPQLLSELKSVILRAFEAIDDGSLGCVMPHVGCWFDYADPRIICRIEECRTEKADAEILRQISCVKLQHVHQRNLRQPISRLPVEMLVKCLSFLTAKDQLSIIRVCRHFHEHVIDAPSLWTCVDQIHHPTALSFVLERAKDLAVDIINLRITEQNDSRLQVIRYHMHHLRILNLHISCEFGIATSTFSTPGPMLQQLSLHGTVPGRIVYIQSLPDAGLFSKLSRLQLGSIRLQFNYDRLRTFRNLRTISLGGIGGGVDDWVSSISSQMPEITTINLEPGSWGSSQGSSAPAPVLRKINIRWTKPGSFSPAEVISRPEAWKSVQAVHVKLAHTSIGLNGNFPIPAEPVPYRSLWVRTSTTGSQRVHVRVVHEDGRERVFCGLDPAAVSGIATRIPGLELTTMTVATTAVALNVLSNSSWPSLRRMRLVSDTHNTAWVRILARDILNIPTLEHLEFSIDRYAVFSWETPIALRVLGCCIAAGHALQKVTFLGFAPEPRCVAGAEMFAGEVTVDRWWREPEDERVWFTEPAFEW